ncbi:fungal-specific transcription factor domain-domain-containing protein [Protomyces lactucae-debilis]|uniref:Fungal-specific transcription factor domain-domain-containing protein n=1 Tax=Protomyces lactucae-debilis TaxID=2754530 RepID=A0A1Y2FJ37_PROLT|nr:fungal-specific transcription factor domain-containing protein [Protomyces lactucae-debilis]ORY83617.1 fungal-specific transcription factor domain-domain-containing protein [Protomyces lactucae-debilis]
MPSEADSPAQVPSPAPAAATTPSQHRRKYTERQRTSQACKKCRTLKRKCSGERPICKNCAGYGFECNYSDTYRGKRVKSESDGESAGTSAPFASGGLSISTDDLSDMREKVNEMQLFLRKIEPQLDADTAAEAQDLARQLENVRLTIKTQDAGRLPALSASCPVPLPVSDSVPATIANGGLDLPPLQIRPSGVLDRSSDLAFVKFVNNQSIKDSQATSGPNPNIAFFLDEGDIVKPNFSSVEDLFRYPTREEGDKLLDAYFSTLHIAVPFLWERKVREIFDKVHKGEIQWSDLDRTTLSMLNFVLALGAYWCNWPYEDHCLYFARGRQLFFDVFKNSTIELIQCHLLACFYLLIINKPARAWNVLGLVIRSCQNLGLVTDTETSATTPVEVERNRRLWYSAYILEHLIALQLGRQPNMRDEDFLVKFPSEVSDWRFREDGTIDDKVHEKDAYAPYLTHLIKFSRIIGIAQRELFFLNKPSMTWEHTMRVISSIDQRLLEWKRSLSRELDFERPSSYETMTALRRQRNFLSLKFRHLRQLIYRPHITLAIMRHTKDPRVVRANRKEQDICLDEAQQTIRLLDHVESQRTLQWDFPLWQLIPCLMSAATILVVGQKLLQDDQPRRERITQDIETCLGIFDSLQKNSAAEKCAALVRSLQGVHLKDIAPPHTGVPPPVDAKTAQSPDSQASSMGQQRYDQSFSLDLDYLTTLDASGLLAAGPQDMVSFDWGENNVW